LLLDMPIRWSSTYVMIDWAEKKKKFVDAFVYQLGECQPTPGKCDQVVQMKLTANERMCIGLFASFLAHADNAQQSFSSDSGPSLYLALPALEALHKAWGSCSEQSKYEVFHTGLVAAVGKISPVPYTMVMLLDPNGKDSHFKKHWGEDLHNEVLENAEKISIIWSCMVRITPAHYPQKQVGKLHKLLQELSSDEDGGGGTEDKVVKQSPWLKEFNLYLKSATLLPARMSIVQWWGINAPIYPVWASLAHDYLAIMSSSVSSERAFSAAAQTITKHCNQLKSDIVEAIQVLHMLYNHDLIFHEPGPSSALELELEGDDEVGDIEVEKQSKESLDWILELFDDSNEE
ncbi:hypothetical protein PAXRUDRAFT_171002, partial [Paxillus rubicundulus Ve08.2h10]